MSNLRSSARIRAKFEAKTAGVIASRNTKVIPVAPESIKIAPPKKRQKKSSPSDAEEKLKSPSVRIRGVRGKLGLMTEMPLDILFETFSHLELSDLLSLTNSNRALREMLFSTSAIYIWKSAFLNIEANPRPPDVPSEMDIVQYAKFLYGRDCSYCSSHNATYAHWAERIRLCKECLEKSVIRPKKYDAVTWTARSIVPVWIVRRPGVDKYDRWYYLREDFKKTMDKLNELQDDSNALAKYQSDRTKDTEERNRFASACRYWESGLKSQRKKQLESLRTKRRLDISAKLIELGWEPEVNRLGIRLSLLPGVDQPRALTPRIWDNIRDDIIETLEEIRGDYLKNQHIQLLHRRAGLLRLALRDLPPTTDIGPDFADLCAVEPIRTMVFGTPPEDTVTQEQFVAALTEHPELSTEWRTSCNQHLFSLLHKPFDVSALKLATVFFRCRWCTEPITYPRVLKHACLTQRHPGLEGDDELQQICNSVPWNFGGEQVSFDDEASAFAREIIETCGQDPGCVTMAEMDSLDPRIECLHCVHPSRGRLVMKWKAALLHNIKTHYDEVLPGPHWKLVDDDATLDLVKIKEAKGILTSRQLYVQCYKCRAHLSQQEIREHLKRSHCITDPADADKNVIIPIDASLHQPPYPVRIQVQ